MSDGLTLGNIRMRLDPNVGDNTTETKIKTLTAELIDLVDCLESPPAPSEAGRLKALAMTGYEEACMWAVKAATAK